MFLFFAKTPEQKFYDNAIIAVTNKYGFRSFLKSIWYFYLKMQNLSGSYCVLTATVAASELVQINFCFCSSNKNICFYFAGTIS